MTTRILAAIGVATILAAGAQSAPPAKVYDYAFLNYNQTDWGPRLVQAGTAGQPAVYDENDEVIYFIKEIWLARQVPPRQKGGRPDYKSGSYRVVLCSMREDGSEKREIRTLWQDLEVEFYIAGDHAWMDIHPGTHKVALSFVYGGDDHTGLWTCDLDGQNLRRIREPVAGRINHANWSPDGQWLVYDEWARDDRPYVLYAKIFRCDTNGQQAVRLSPEGLGSTHPMYSPDGSMIAFAGSQHLWLMDSDGRNARELRGNTYNGELNEACPTWFDQEHVHSVCHGLVKIATGEVLPKTAFSYWLGHWGRKGLAGFGMGQIGFTPRSFEGGSVVLLGNTSGAEPRKIARGETWHTTW